MKFRNPETGEVYDDIKDALEHYCPAKDDRDVDACKRCAIGSSKNTDDTICTDFSVDHPTEAARLMGYEVIDDVPHDSSGTCGICENSTPFGICGMVKCTKTDRYLPCEHKCDLKEDNMKQNDKPAVATAGCKPERSPLAKVLDVEEDATWRYPGIIGLFRIHSGIRQTWNHTFGGWCACNNEQDLTYMISCPDAIILSPMLTDQELKQCQVFGVKYLTRNWDKEIVHMWDAKPTENVDDTGKYYTIGNSGAMDLGAVDASFFPSVEPNDCICVADRNKESF